MLPRAAGAQLLRGNPRPLDAEPFAANLAVGPLAHLQRTLPYLDVGRPPTPANLGHRNGPQRDAPWLHELPRSGGLEGCGPEHSRWLSQNGWVLGLHHRQTLRPTGQCAAGLVREALRKPSPPRLWGRLANSHLSSGNALFFRFVHTIHKQTKLATDSLLSQNTEEQNQPCRVQIRDLQNPLQQQCVVFRFCAEERLHVSVWPNGVPRIFIPYSTCGSVVSPSPHQCVWVADLRCCLHCLDLRRLDSAVPHLRLPVLNLNLCVGPQSDGDNVVDVLHSIRSTHDIQVVLKGEEEALCWVKTAGHGFQCPVADFGQTDFWPVSVFWSNFFEPKSPNPKPKDLHSDLHPKPSHSQTLNPRRGGPTLWGPPFGTPFPPLLGPHLFWV